MKPPAELSAMFNEVHFTNYPLVAVPQSFSDSRGEILNIADGILGDVAVIYSKQNSVRANHVHANDWHLSYMVSGSMRYSWSDENGPHTILVSAGELVYTPPRVAHKMTFLADSCFIAVAALNRDSQNYELDTKRLDENFFEAE